MLIENSFEVPAPVDRLWAYLLDVERVAPCMPGAELTEVIDDRNWKGKVNMKFGPVALSFAGTVTMEERDDAAHRVVLKAQGMEQRGKGAASAGVTSWLEPGEGKTTVKIVADITLTGTVAQLSRGLLPDVSAKLTRQFVDCLQTNMGAVEEAPRPAEPATGGAPPSVAAAPGPAPQPRVAAKPVGGIRLGLWALFRAIVRFFRELFGRRGVRP